MKSRLFLAALFAVSTLFTACNENEKKPANPRGNLKATVNPKDAATSMKIAIEGADTVLVSPSNGVFTAKGIPAGEHTVVFTPSVGYDQAGTRRATIEKNKTTDMGVIAFDLANSPMAMKARVGSTNWDAVSASAVVQNNSFTLIGSDAAQTSLTLNIPSFTGPGIYSDAAVVAAIDEDGDTWTTGLPNTTATVNISKHDVANKKVSGTFSFEAAAAPGSTATGGKKITGGSFTNVSF